jgi:hypothetical protein
MLKEAKQSQMFDWIFAKRIYSKHFHSLFHHCIKIEDAFSQLKKYIFCFLFSHKKNNVDVADGTFTSGKQTDAD